MDRDFRKYGQYQNDMFSKMALNFEKGKRLLDVGCGPGSDSEIFIKEFDLDVCGIDIYKHGNIENIKGLNFIKSSIFNMPFDDNSFDYIFLHDVLHHINEPNQEYQEHIKGLEELKRVCKSGGKIIIVEGNRYNPLFYPHMVLMNGHNHFTQKYFKKIIKDVFEGAEFKSFEAHFYPKRLIGFFKIFEMISERISFFSPFRSYNLAIISNNK